MMFCLEGQMREEFIWMGVGGGGNCREIAELLNLSLVLER